jgi:hypothetical protein
VNLGLTTPVTEADFGVAPRMITGQYLCSLIHIGCIPMWFGSVAGLVLVAPLGNAVFGF